MMNPRIKKAVKWFVLIVMTLCAVVYTWLFIQHKAEDAFFAKEAKNWTHETFQFRIIGWGPEKAGKGEIVPGTPEHAEVLAYLSEPQTRDGWLDINTYAPMVEIRASHISLILFENSTIVGTSTDGGGGGQVSRKATELDRRIRELVLSLNLKAIDEAPTETKDAP